MHLVDRPLLRPNRDCIVGAIVDHDDTSHLGQQCCKLLLKSLQIGMKRHDHRSDFRRVHHNSGRFR